MNLTRLKILSSVALLAALAACGPTTRWDHTPQDEHVVRTGETLYAIAWRYSIDPNDLALWNKLGDGSLIHPGQAIRLTSPPGMESTRSSSASRSASSTPPQSLPDIPTQPSPGWA